MVECRQRVFIVIDLCVCVCVGYLLISESTRLCYSNQLFWDLKGKNYKYFVVKTYCREDMAITCTNDSC